jgi:hypothetical protein
MKTVTALLVLLSALNPIITPAEELEDVQRALRAWHLADEHGTAPVPFQPNLELNDCTEIPSIDKPTKFYYAWGPEGKVLYQCRRDDCPATGDYLYEAGE